MKRAMVGVTPELISQMLLLGNEIHIEVENGLPEDAKFVKMLSDRRTVYLVYESAEFEDIPDQSTEIPVLRPARLTVLDRIPRMMMDEINRIVLQAMNDGSVLIVERARDTVIGTMCCYAQEIGFYVRDTDVESSSDGQIRWEEIISVSIQDVA